MTGLMANPPRPGDPSYERFARERDNILASLKRRATLVARKCNELKGYSCNEVDGALYAFPKLLCLLRPSKLLKQLYLEAVSTRFQI
eukprot:g57072.t1